MGENDAKIGEDLLITRFKQDLIIYQEYLYIGIRFPGRHREYDWLYIRLRRSKSITEVAALIKPENADLVERLETYVIEAIYCEPITEEDYHLRNKGAIDRAKQKTSKISIIGCGALGGGIADCFAKAGIGQMILVDKGEFRYHNSIRHVLAVTKTGLPKVWGLMIHVFEHNRFVSVDTVAQDIYLTEINKYIPEKCIGISTIADDNVEAFLNEEAIFNEKVVFYARALRGGKAGRIFRVIPHKDACKNCLSIYRDKNMPGFINIPQDDDLPIITNECNNPIRAGSAADLQIISSIVSKILIEYIEGKGLDKNHWVWTTENDIEEASGYRINYKLEASFLPPVKECPVCKEIISTKISILEEAYVFIKKESKESGEIETGGVIIGYKNHNGDYVAVKCTGPGPKAKRTKTMFIRDVEFCQAEIERSAKELFDKGAYIGEWHYHPTGSNKPSAQDIKSLTEIAQQKEYLIDNPISIIISPENELGITLHDETGRCVDIEIEVITKGDNLNGN
ncbi:MAG: ThiF family adenylyltransferase [bacterium]|nr:ThiF family adenylyltransferase [bacterium]